MQNQTMDKDFVFTITQEELPFLQTEWFNNEYRRLLMNGRKAKLIRRQAEKLQVQWINSLLTEDTDKITNETLDQALPDQEY